MGKDVRSGRHITMTQGSAQGKGNNKKNHIPKKESTQLKIQLAWDVLTEKGIEVPWIKFGRSKLPSDFRGIKHFHTIERSNKWLCGHLGKLCQIMKDNNITYPWREVAND